MERRCDARIVKTTPATRQPNAARVYRRFAVRTVLLSLSLSPLLFCFANFCPFLAPSLLVSNDTRDPLLPIINPELITKKYLYRDNLWPSIQDFDQIIDRIREYAEIRRRFPFFRLRDYSFYSVSFDRVTTVRIRAIVLDPFPPDSPSMARATNDNRARFIDASLLQR